MPPGSERPAGLPRRPHAAGAGGGGPARRQGPALRLTARAEAKAFHVVRDAVKALSGKEEMELGIIEQYVAAKDLAPCVAGGASGTAARFGSAGAWSHGGWRVPRLRGGSTSAGRGLWRAGSG